MTALEIDRLSKSYGAVQALREMTFSVRAGEVFGFVGSNGAGKTTTMRIALGVLRPDAGEVRWEGRPVDLQTRRQIGYMPEERGLYPKMKVGEQLVHLARLHGLGGAEAASAMLRWTDRLGLSARRDEEVQKLSLGNQQRVQLAAALVHDPRILVLDEPFSGLDPVAVDVMSEVLRERADAGVPVVFSSHQLDLVERLCDTVGIVRAGSMVASGGIDDLRSGGGHRWRITVPGAPEGWASGVTGAAVVERQGDSYVLSVADPSAGIEQAVLRAGLAAGPVAEFARHRASLTDLFRDVVSAEPDACDVPPDPAGPPGRRSRASKGARA